MTPYIIAGIILAVGAGIELLAYIFACRMLKKKEDGLNRLKEHLLLYEQVLDEWSDSAHRFCDAFTEGGPDNAV